MSFLLLKSAIIVWVLLWIVAPIVFGAAWLWEWWQQRKERKLPEVRNKKE